MSLVPPGGSDSPNSRRSVSPLLETRRPICTLNCDPCAAMLEEKLKHAGIETRNRGTSPISGSPRQSVVGDMPWFMMADEDRPDFSALMQNIQRMRASNSSRSSDSTSQLEALVMQVEQYATSLETLVEERTADYLDEKRKCEDLLYQLMPKPVASQLIRGRQVAAETFDQVTIYFSDIVGFTEMCTTFTPMDVVAFLNDLYTCFDSVLEGYDVYKVETVGDAYMVASGLPVRNGTRHALELARMAIKILEIVSTMKVPRTLDQQLHIRIGMHTGPCVSGVVGLKMPRYCLFGDTVNTASRMETTGVGNRIHISTDTKLVLDIYDCFDFECRGPIAIKGKGEMVTYFLQKEKKTNNPDAQPFNRSMTIVEVDDENPSIRCQGPDSPAAHSIASSQGSNNVAGGAEAAVAAGAAEVAGAAEAAGAAGAAEAADAAGLPEAASPSHDIPQQRALELLTERERIKFRLASFMAHDLLNQMNDSVNEICLRQYPALAAALQARFAFGPAPRARAAADPDGVITAGHVRATVRKFNYANANGDHKNGNL